ncbi:protein serine/threonine phosphatase [Candidatus Protofrankia californiensis]|uniref:Protein serine/threonine phosphatase n=1 Tax=Candidatus Protofrankia californiensis TaxID=1839754 RepID=A0A1C3PG98_9ACTN|nr:PP2C family protein-serine/threonine phosphatase [Protofrankia symbiont of Coriaria ruscifolia]SBW28861.1 protein serine/threonine phosphatase [Candidatus Protofrankia californiensis]
MMGTVRTVRTDGNAVTATDGGLLGPLGLLVVLVVADIVVPRINLTGFYGLVPLLASATGAPVATVIVGLAAVAASVVSGAWEDFGSGQHVTACLLVAIQAGVAVYVAVMRLRRERELGRVRAVADVAQRALLPAVPGAVDGIAFAARYLSAAAETLVGGDLYEVVTAPAGTRMIIGDVKGKGLPAVRLTTVVLGAFREAAVVYPEIERVAEACARAVSREAGAEDFVTALIVDIQPDGTLWLISAGHPPPVLLSGDSARPLQITEPSPPLGIAEHFTATTGRWDPGDRLLLFTDGLIEARNSERAFFRLDDHLAALTAVTLDAALDRLVSHVHGHVGGNLHDDLALLIAERLPTLTTRTVESVGTLHGRTAGRL